MTESLQVLLSELERFGEANDGATAERPRRMLNITRDTGEFLSVLVQATSARRVLEIGTSNGYSTLWLARAARATGGAVTTVEVADYKVVLEPDDTVVGTLNEDFAIESNAGDIFQLGNASWQIMQVGSGVVRVADAKGAPPTIPFWLGEAPARSDELSRAVSELRRDIAAHVECAGHAGALTAAAWPPHSRITAG